MIQVSPQFVHDAEGRRTSVTLSPQDWDKVVDALEELEDVRAYDEAKAGDQESLPLEQAVAELEALDE